MFEARTNISLNKLYSCSALQEFSWFCFGFWVDVMRWFCASQYWEAGGCSFWCWPPAIFTGLPELTNIFLLMGRNNVEMINPNAPYLDCAPRLELGEKWPPKKNNGEMAWLIFPSRGALWEPHRLLLVLYCWPHPLKLKVWSPQVRKPHGHLIWITHVNLWFKIQMNWNQALLGRSMFGS